MLLSITVIEFSPQNLSGYLHRRGLISDPAAVRVQSLSGGVSNVVMRVDGPEGAFVVKQSREKLRTKADWRSRPERIWRESATLQLLSGLLPHHVPRLLDEDREQMLFAMSAVPIDHVVWKQALLAGQTDPPIAEQAGRLLAIVHQVPPSNLDEFADQTVFYELRVDPFYSYVARRHPNVASAIARLTQEMDEHRQTLVLADYSPKNMLLVQGQLVLVDFETAHLGDPAFDIGFFASHLVLKAMHRSADSARFENLLALFWNRYAGASPLFWEEDSLRARERRAVRHLAACALARVDGKSPVDYLNDETQQRVRIAAIDQLFRPADSLRAAVQQMVETGR